MAMPKSARSTRSPRRQHRRLLRHRRPYSARQQNPPVRGGIVITDDLAIESLKRLKDDAKEVKSGLECGIKLAGYDDIKEGDILEAYVREMIQRTL